VNSEGSGWFLILVRSSGEGIGGQKGCAIGFFSGTVAREYKSPRRMEMYVRAADIKTLRELTGNGGQVRGVALCTDAQYVRQYAGDEILQDIQLLTRELGHAIEYRIIEAAEWYPISLRVASLLAIRKALDWDDEGLREMGKSAPKYSVTDKFILRYVIGVQEFIERLQTYWSYSYSGGSLRGIVIDKSAFVCVHDFLIPSILCNYLEGVFVGILGMIIGKEQWITVRETDGWHSSNNCHDFVLRW
jgi:hypothetical protein